MGPASVPSSVCDGATINTPADGIAYCQSSGYLSVNPELLSKVCVSGSATGVVGVCESRTISATITPNAITATITSRILGENFRIGMLIPCVARVMRIERVTQAVADQIEAHHRDQDQDARPD